MSETRDILDTLDMLARKYPRSKTHARAAAEIRRLHSLVEGRWQPIETAPKDGTRVLGFRASYAEAYAVVWWIATWEEWRPVNGSVFPGPTHWMPLPEPPHDGGTET